jgi:hypothetical protein
VEKGKPASEETVEPRRTREFSLPASLYPPRIEEPLEDGGGPKTLTLLDGTTIPWAAATQKGFAESNTGFEFFEELATLEVDPDGIVRTRQYIAAILRLMFKKKIIAPEDFAAQLEKFSLDPQKK